MAVALSLILLFVCCPSVLASHIPLKQFVGNVYRFFFPFLCIFVLDVVYCYMARTAHIDDKLSPRHKQHPEAGTSLGWSTKKKNTTSSISSNIQTKATVFCHISWACSRRKRTVPSILSMWFVYFEGTF